MLEIALKQCHDSGNIGYNQCHRLGTLVLVVRGTGETTFT